MEPTATQTPTPAPTDTPEPRVTVEPTLPLGAIQAINEQLTTRDSNNNVVDWEGAILSAQLAPRPSVGMTADEEWCVIIDPPYSIPVLTNMGNLTYSRAIIVSRVALAWYVSTLLSPTSSDASRTEQEFLRRGCTNWQE